MNDDFTKGLRINFSGIGCWLTLILVGWLLWSVGLGWLVNSVLIMIVLLLLAPVVAWFGFRWWLKRKLIEDSCPVCQYEFTGFEGTTCRCPSCSEPLKVEGGSFQRITPPGTIDVEAIEVQPKSLEE